MACCLLVYSTSHQLQQGNCHTFISIARACDIPDTLTYIIAIISLALTITPHPTHMQGTFHLVYSLLSLKSLPLETSKLGHASLRLVIHSPIRCRTPASSSEKGLLAPWYPGQLSYLHDMCVEHLCRTLACRSWV